MALHALMKIRKILIKIYLPGASEFKIMPEDFVYPAS